MTAAFNLSQLANNLNTSGQLDATDGLTGAVPVANGGTGATSLAANNVLIGNGTGAVQTVSPGASGNVLTSNGTTWVSQAGGAGGTDVQTFNSSGTWTKPSAGSMARIQVWGGGGGGGRGSSNNFVSGGGGGGYNEVTVPLSSLGATVTVTIGGGGAGRTGSAGQGGQGGDSSFGTTCLAYGGAGGNGTQSSSANRAGGGGQLSAGTSGVPESTPSTQGNPQVFNTFWHGGWGVQGASLSNSQTCPSVFGGGGGGFTDALRGLSVYGGNGGFGTGGNGTSPGGGGGCTGSNTNGGNGAAGRVVVTVW
jgi:hypothetical protein